MVRPAIALAQGDSLAAAPAVTAPLPSTMFISSARLQAFADLVGEPLDIVALRLYQDPNLIGPAVAAADARLARKRSGKWMAVSGFTLHAFGTILVWYALLETSGPVFPEGDQRPPVSSTDKAIGIGGLVAAVVGLALAIPGVIRIARESKTETEAIERYTRPEVPYRPPFARDRSDSLGPGPSTGIISVSLPAIAF